MPFSPSPVTPLEHLCSLHVQRTRRERVIVTTCHASYSPEGLARSPLESCFEERVFGPEAYRSEVPSTCLLCRRGRNRQHGLIEDELAGRQGLYTFGGGEAGWHMCGAYRWLG